MPTLIRQPLQMGNIIRSRRKELGWTQEVLAEKTGLRQATISQIETGSHATRIGTILKVIAVLDLDLLARPRQRRPIEEIL